METICDAIRGMNLLSFTYDGHRRLVEPHTYGMDNKGHRSLRAYQISGGSESGEYVGWKLFHTDEIRALAIEAQKFVGPRPKYKRGDTAFSTIYCQL